MSDTPDEAASETRARTGISASAARSVRLSFNPSGNARVDRIKCLAAELVTELESLAPSNARADAIRQVVQASMWSVYAATENLA